jgi:hypothetical protein
MSYGILMELLVKPVILISYIYRPTFCNAESRLYLLKNVSTLKNAESYPVSQLCVNTLLATKVTLITYGI